MSGDNHQAPARRAYSRHDLAEAWGVSVGAVETLLRDGELSGFRVGRRVLIPVESVDAYERSHSTGRDGSKGAGK